MAQDQEATVASMEDLAAVLGASVNVKAVAIVEATGLVERKAKTGVTLIFFKPCF